VKLGDVQPAPILPRIDWVKWQLLPARVRKRDAKELADCIADAPDDIHIAVLVALGKRSREKIAARNAKNNSGRGFARPAIVSAAHQAVIDQYRREDFDVNVAAIVAQFRKRFSRPPRDDWQETRKALLIAACDDLLTFEGLLPNPLARKLVAEKYRGLPLGVSPTTKENVSLRLSATVLWKINKIGAHLPGGPSPDALGMDLHLCGRR